MKNEKTNPLSTKIGIIGGGQLGKMMILEAKKLGFFVAVIDPSESCPCSTICDLLITAALDDADAINRLGELCDVITYEIEHIGVDALLRLEESGKAVYPTCKSLRVIQNKLSQNETLKAGGVPIPDFCGISSTADIERASRDFGFPLMLKAATGGYDGKGNFLIRSADEVKTGFDALGGGKIPLLAEKFADFTDEISVLACRGIDGSVVVYPVGKNIHKDSILDKTLVPAPVSETAYSRAGELARKSMEIFDGVGMFCVEMFVMPDESVLVNEVAPRPHNSGHYTIEACNVSQFEQHIRAVSGLPLANVTLHTPAVMKNILGAGGSRGDAVVSGVSDALRLNGVSLHVYGKKTSIPGRKMGHLTACALNDETLSECEQKAERAAGFIKISGGE